ncbi:Extracellular metalloprotease [Penicillium cataractarum]|uniref:Extracellular metalloprotease n=1 Tax=Penicillium cataractarum TaxID=2100454 RepID=A0A9W9V1W1_9EURO|nr:Extracellular metalloprotease [Penicillium cataractarum]KAJ5364659.1 Extracellular metalloprotease [Penicillium cataractarum]
MVCHSLAPFVVLVTTLFFLQAHCSPVVVEQRGICATEDPDTSFLHALERVRINESQPKDAGSESRNGPIEIETWFHIIASKAKQDQVSDDMIDSQLSILQDAYQDAGIQYRLQGVTRHVNDVWARNGDDLGMKKTLRKGTYRTLNVYFQTDLQASADQTGRVNHRGAAHSSDLSTSVLGFCTLPDPSVNASSPRADYVKDGCNILASAMSGGSLDQYNRGGTAIHEIGHWNGLLHTFQGESCSEDNPGDYIADTPLQSTPTGGCPARKDSCPDSPGLDPIHDFMDYSSDVCYESFTAGQNDRMRNMWATMRAGK